MTAVFEGRQSNSPYIAMVWRGHVEQDYFPLCPADVRWNLLITKLGSKVRVSVEGATNQCVPKTQPEGMEFLVIKFQLGVFMPYIPVQQLVNTDAILPHASHTGFQLNGTSWQLPDFNNAEVFVQKLIDDGTLVCEPVVDAVIKGRSPYVSSRTVRRRFLHTTGVTPKTIEQIERAHQAVALLQSGRSILDTAHLVGYSDQPHMTRAIKRFYGQTPGEIALST